MKKLMITIDVEAQPGRAEAHHVDRLIWGKCPNGQAGISEMMDLADRHGIRLTLFLDYTEQHLYGEELLDVGREIWRRGHDLQLHAHLEFLPKAFWLDRGLSACYKLDEVSLRQADAVFDFLCARHHDITGQQPIAFRGGGYRFNDAVLRSMRVRGLLIDTSLNVARERRTVLTTPRKQFAWSTGCLEIPISLASSFRNRHQQFEFNFNSSAFTDAASLIDFLDQFYDEHGEDAIAVLVMHSWSFLRLLNRKYFTEVLPSNLEKFDEFLSRLPGDVTVVDTRDLASLYEQNALPLDPEIPFESLLRTSTVPHSPEAAAIEARTCPICGAAGSRFVEMNGRRCPDCGSLERQRAFALAYSNEIHHDFPLEGKRVLIFSPAVSELRLLDRFSVSERLSADIRPEARPDLLLDICDMQQIASASQECVFASYIMPNVYDLEAALDEVRRVLSPDGVFISMESLRPGKTRPVEDLAAVTSWYGKESYEKYKVGTHRILGDEDYLSALRQRFEVSRYAAQDPITGQICLVHLCRLSTRTRREDSPSVITERPPRDSYHASPSMTSMIEDFIKPRFGLLARRPKLLAHTLNTEQRAAFATVADILPPVLTSWRALADPATANLACTLDSYETETIDVFFSTNIVDFLPDVQQLLRSIARVLTPDGYLFIGLAHRRVSLGTQPPEISYYLDPARFSLPQSAAIPSIHVGRDWLRAELSTAGLTPVDTNTELSRAEEKWEWFIATKSSRAVADTRSTSTPVPQVTVRHPSGNELPFAGLSAQPFRNREVE